MRSRIWASLVRIAHYWPVPAILVAWDLWVLGNGYTSTVAPRPWSVIADVVTQFHAYRDPVLYTLGMSIGGLIGGTVVGFVGAVLVWWSSALSGVVTPAALVVRSVPLTAMIPIIARVVGYGDTAVLASTILISFFPAFVLTLSGLNSIPAVDDDLVASLGGGRWQLFRRVGLLHALPNLAVSVRITAPTAILAAMLAEFLMGSHGLGALFSQSQGYQNADRAWGTALIASVVSLLVFTAARVLERRVTTRVT
ncbi:ABC transporter permease [Gordonia sp. DT30]|uniref:ABC transporter permease n=1 Tax=Gordonia sp. DT30 TaxID=3416546 RepID=UPI003CF53F8A